MKIARWIIAAICIISFATLGGAAMANDETKELSATVEKQANNIIDISKLEFVEATSTPTVFESENAEPDLKVYKDSNNVKYRFKENKKHGNVLCGIQKERYYATYIPGGKIIAEEKARQIADDYLKEYIENFKEYKFNTLTYSECDAVFVINYYLPVQGFVSDDQIVIYITWDGEVGAFSAFNRYHFEDAPVLDTNKLEQNQASVM